MRSNNILTSNAQRISVYRYGTTVAIQRTAWYTHMSMVHVPVQYCTHPALGGQRGRMQCTYVQAINSPFLINPKYPDIPYAIAKAANDIQYLIYLS